jgi:hypothetical protein
MNRNRRAAAKARNRSGYQHHLLATLNVLDLPPGELSHIVVEHDESCAFEAGRCTCTPDITRRTDNRLLRVGPHGEVEETPLS